MVKYIFRLSGCMRSIELLPPFWPLEGKTISCISADIRCIENVILFRQFLCHSAHNMDLYSWVQGFSLHLPCVLTSQEVSRTVTSTVHFWDTLGLTVTIIVMNWSQAAQVSSVAQVYCLFIPLFLSSLKYWYGHFWGICSLLYCTLFLVWSVSLLFTVCGMEK